jgi:hypothetical protein
MIYIGKIVILPWSSPVAANLLGSKEYRDFLHMTVDFRPKRTRGNRNVIDSRREGPDPSRVPFVR